MLDRGRSRHVSQVALARRLSEEQARQFVPEHVIIWPPCPPPRRATKTRAINTAGFNSALASSTLPRLVLPSHSPSATGPASGGSRPGSSRQTAATLQPRTTAAASTETPTRCGLLSPPTCYLPSLSDGSPSNLYGSPGSSRTASVSPAVSPSEPLTPHCGATDYIDFVPPVVYDAVSESLIVDESSQARDMSECSPIVIDLDPNDTWEDITDGPGLTLPPEFEEALAVEEAASARKRVEEELWTERGRWAEKVERRWERMRRIMREQRDLGRQARAEHEAFVASQTARKVRRKTKIASKSSIEIHPTHFSTITGRLINGTARASGSTSVPPSPIAARSSSQAAFDGSFPAEVPMQEVFNSMHGALFHDSVEENGVKSSSELRHLLEPVVWERGERWAKYNRIFGNGEERPDYRVAPRRRDFGNGEECLTCKSGLSCADTSASQSSFATSTRSALSRATGWISFRSSRDSTSSSATSVTSSALSTKAPSLYPSNESTSHQLSSSSLIVSFPRRCECPTSWRLVAHGHDPLTYNEEGPATKPYAYEEAQDQRYLIQPARSSSLPLRAGWRRLCESVAVFVDSAHRLQEAYLNATLLSNPAYDPYDPYPRRRPSPSYSRSYSRVRNMSPYETSDSLALRSRPKPGYRVTSDSLRQFLLKDAAPTITPTAGKSMIPPSLPPRTITLRDLSPATRLRIFAPLPIPPRSPLKPRWAPRQPEGRYRPVSNRCFLRIRALVNVCAAEGITWEGVAPVPIGTVMLPGGSGAVATGAERLRGVAMDGIGFSALRREILLE